MPDSSPLDRTAMRLRAERGLRRGFRNSRAWARALRPGAPGMLPDFLVIGAMRCGTTSLFAHLADHPHVEPALGKELQYFSLFYDKGERWYRGHFPPAQGDRRTFEASPYYLYHPMVPLRVRTLLPEGRFIALLRDPVDRAFSHYKHTVERGVEPLAFIDAVHAEEARLAPYLSSGDLTSSKAHAALRNHSYVSRGRYAEQLERWFDAFSRDQILVIKSEELYARPADVYARCLKFLGLPEHVPAAFGVHGRVMPPMSTAPESAREELRAMFAPHNERLSDLLGWPSTWPTTSP